MEDKRYFHTTHIVGTLEVYQFHQRSDQWWVHTTCIADTISPVQLQCSLKGEKNNSIHFFFIFECMKQNSSSRDIKYCLTLNVHGGPQMQYCAWGEILNASNAWHISKQLFSFMADILIKASGIILCIPPANKRCNVISHWLGEYTKWCLQHIYSWHIFF